MYLGLLGGGKSFENFSGEMILGRNWKFLILHGWGIYPEWHYGPKEDNWGNEEKESTSSHDFLRLL